jgi:uncharacterized protein YqeY
MLNGRHCSLPDGLLQWPGYFAHQDCSGTSMLERLRDDLKAAMKRRDEVTVRVLRMVLADIHNREIAAREELEDDQILDALRKGVKLRQEAAEQFAAGGREERAADEKAEIEVLEVYLPRMLSGDELTAAVDEVVGDLGASSMADMGNVMKGVMAKVGGQAEGKVVNEVVKERLSR